MKLSCKNLCLTLVCACLVLGAGVSTASAKPVVVASTNFTEQLILGNIYAQVLEARGVEVETRLHLGSREIVFPALQAGEVDILPEYSGALLAFITNGQSKAKTPDAVLGELRNKLPDGIVALEAASAQDKDGLVVTADTAKEYDLETFSDLAAVAGKLTAGGPAETKTRYVGLPGLKEVYGIEFAGFRSLDSAGPLTQGALAQGAIDVARMYSTQGVIPARGWILLEDDKNLVPAQNLLPVARASALTPEIRAALNAISAALTTEQLQQMNKRVTVDKDDPSTVASDWVAEHDL